MTNDKPTLFREAGFFSDSVDEWSEKYCVTNKSELDRADNLAAIALGLAYRKTGVHSSIGQLELFVVAALFVRCISNFQGSLLLLKKGMNIDARILVRSCLECTFMLAAAREKGAEFVTRLIRQHHDSRKKIGLEFDKVHKKSGVFTAEQAAEIRRIAENHISEGAETYNFYLIAQHGGLESWYIFYRQLSNYAAHPSLDSLACLFDEESESIVFGPSSDAADLVDIIDLGSTFLISACTSFNQHLGEDTALTAQLDAEFRKLKRWQEYQSREGDLP